MYKYFDDQIMSGNTRAEAKKAYSRSELAHNEEGIKANVVDDYSDTGVGGDHIPAPLLPCKHSNEISHASLSVL